MGNIIEIKKVDDIKIKKIKKDFAIYFSIGDKNYILKKQEELGEPTVISLFERKINKYGYYQLTFIKDVIKDIDLNTYFFGEKSTYVYSHLDKSIFAFKLTFLELAKGVYCNEVRKTKEELKNIKNQIKSLEKTIMFLKKHEKAIEEKLF